MDVNWTTLILGVLSPVSALGGVCLTLYFQERREKSGSGVTLATDLLTSAEIYYFAIKRSADHVSYAERADEQATKPAQKPIERDEALRAAGKWTEARSRASVSIRSHPIRHQIDVVTEAIGKYERAYLWVEGGVVKRKVAWSEYNKARATAWEAIENLRGMLHRRLARRF